MAAQTYTAEIAYRLGRGARSATRRWARCEHHVTARLVTNGVAPAVAQLLLSGVKFAALGAFFYILSWLAALAAFAIAAAWVVANSADGCEDEEMEWRYGHSGFGLYDKNEWRHDPGDFDKR
ncbi:MAG: DUF3742 family protein [Shinella sp.]|nr:DUF3742 family protein [Shinella sp.]